MIRSLMLTLLIIGGIWLIADQISGHRYIGNFVNKILGLKG